MNMAVFAPKPGCGASTVSRMLALTLAKKCPVLLVELDFYYPSTTLALGLYDEQRNLDRSLDDFNRKGAESFRLTDYVIPYRKTKLSVLSPYGKKGFEFFPKEHPDFIPTLLRQASQVGFAHVVLDAPSLVDTIFCLSALEHADRILFVLNDEYANTLLYHHRMELFKEMNITTDVEIIANHVRSKSDAHETLKKAIPDKGAGLVIPYLAKLHRVEKTGELVIPSRLQKKLETFLRGINQKTTDQTERKYA